ncbi:MAG: alpha,alpha-trehalose-phosphate synthase (UDP-forming) [Candidatus Dormibacteraceae bacterium]
MKEQSLSSPDVGRSLRSYTERVLGPWSPIIVSNRAPYEPTADGSFRRGQGGLVTALLTVAEATSAPWVAVARGDLERDLAATGKAVPTGRSGISIHYATPTPEQYHMYYSVIANPLLWFIQHYLWDLTHEPVIDDDLRYAWDEGYVEVNREVATIVAKVARRARRPPLILTQDYQLYLAPRVVRQMVPEAVLQQFVHIPWPTPQYWKILSQRMRDAIVDGLLANDVVGFQSSLDVRNFLITCEENTGARVDHRERAVLHRGRVVWVRSYPISIDVGALERMATSGGVAREEERLAAWRPQRLIVRVDRTDPSKNIVRGFLAYERLLESHPELAGEVQFWAFLQPSRQDVPNYRDYLRRIRQTAARINQQLGGEGWQPIILELGDNIRRAVAAYRNFDVLLVNPIYDGMNLVAKEGMLVNRTDGVLVLSENAGAHEELGTHALTINPFDVDATADALYEALSLPADERRRRGDAIRRVVRTNDIDRWISHQLQDLRDLVGTPSGPGR